MEYRDGLIRLPENGFYRKMTLYQIKDAQILSTVGTLV